MSPVSCGILTRVERALKRLGLLNKQCDFIEKETGMKAPGTDDNDFNKWLTRLEKLSPKKLKHDKRNLVIRLNDKQSQNKIYYEKKKAKKHTRAAEITIRT